MTWPQAVLFMVGTNTANEIRVLQNEARQTMRTMGAIDAMIGDDATMIVASVVWCIRRLEAK